ncbi:hypothetical protein LX64_02175 [Chitinophaga skermanii]|uniref:Uncharacterized protein n=1 Tax=Chitinophaga skermanii TaxID=331697 RepID=A0A327QL28_9BACT|nr:hypothetical protein [Chitinophaga skermanii]RAJ05021.1 hypothetical protein LX64_02175 [Chitinophaga skermanii]
MKLKIGTYDGSEFRRSRYTGRSVADVLGIRLAADAVPNDNDLPANLRLFAVQRPLLGIKKHFGEHCFLLVKGDGPEVLQSISYGPNGAGPDVRALHDLTNTTAYVQTIPRQTWLNLKNYYYNNCGQYHLFSHNCCTCTRNALLNQGLAVPTIITDANHHIGTTGQCAVM